MAERRTLIALVAYVASWLMSVSPAWADGNSAPMLCFSEAGYDYPRYSIWTGSSWPDEVSARNINNEAPWVVLKNCPTRDEYAMGTLDWGKDVNVQFYGGGSWTNPVEVTNNTETYSQRAFDLAYEQQTGDCLIAYWDKSPKKVGYRIYNGAALSGESLLTLPSNKKVKWIKLCPDPNSDKVILLALNDRKDLFASVWSGSAWGSVTTLETDTGKKNEECFAMAFESQSGNGLVVYAQKDKKNPRYRTWDGSTWSSEGQLPSVGKKQRWLRLAADPVSDQILFGSLDDDKDINVNAWNGSSWGSNQELEKKACWNQMRAFDIAYESGGTRALIVYPDDWDDKFRYRTWNGSSWSSEVWGKDLDQVITTPQLVTGVNPGEIFLATQDDGDDLNMMLWNGSSFSSNNRIESRVTSWGRQCYMMAVPAAAAAPVRIINWREVQRTP